MTNQTIARGATLLALFVTVTVLAGAGDDANAKNPSPAKAAFEQLKKLKGDWVAANPENPADADRIASSFRVTSAGSAVIEVMEPGEDHEMITMYYMEGDDLILIHYCALGNQPRMKFKAGQDATKAKFEFDGGDNVDVSKDTHMHDAEFEFVSEDRLKVDWSLWKEGHAAGGHAFELKRKK